MVEATIKLLRRAATEIPPDVMNALKNALRMETHELAKRQLELIIKNCEIASKENVPICQDTGLICFFVRVGDEFPIKANLYQLLEKAVRKATKTIPLRPNAVHPITGINTGDNVGRYAPVVETELVPGDSLEIKVMLKGGGSEYPSRLYVLKPSRALEVLPKAVLTAIAKRAAFSCPPIIVGIGLGSTVDMALRLARRALMRPLGQRNEDSMIAELEEKLLKMINRLGIGTMGLGGDITALDVKIEWAHRHPASFPLGIVLQCWALRKASCTIRPDGSYRLGW
ncbi:MAG: fumarate hydratase [Thermoprotei archaeon]|nr:MAG: fumarate hydratase [Thermoprotei archaeon]